MDMNWRQMWVAVGIVFAIVASTVTITLTVALVVTDRQISGLERSLAQLERSQTQQAESTLALVNAQNENVLALMNAQNENVLGQLRLLNDKMNNIETEHAELRSLYEKVGVLQAEVAYIRRDLNTMRADLDRVLKILEALDGN